MSPAPVTNNWDNRYWSDAENRDALNKLRHASEYLDRQSLNAKFEQTDAEARAILDAAFQTLRDKFSEELMWRSLPRGEDR